MKDESDRERDLQDVLSTERNRGVKRRPVDPEEQRRAKRLRQDILKAYREGDEMGVRIALLAAGWAESSPEFEAALKSFREALRSRPTR